MANSSPAIADSSPLILFGIIGTIDLVAAVLGELLVPDAVWHEVVDAGNEKPGASAVHQSPSVRRRTVGTIPLHLRERSLGAGEREVIALALEVGPAATLLVDDQNARRVARELGFSVIGCAGVLLLAKQRRLIAAVNPVLDELLSAGLFLDRATQSTVLERAQEE